MILPNFCKGGKLGIAGQIYPVSNIHLLPYDDRRSVISRGYAESGPVTLWRCLSPVAQASCRDQLSTQFLHLQDRVHYLLCESLEN